MHREIYKLVNPDTPIDGYVIRHSCDNPKCINPAHLLIGSVKDNILDMDLRNRRYKKITSQIKEQVVSMLKEGLSQREIAETMQLDIRRISDIKVKFFKES